MGLNLNMDLNKLPHIWQTVIAMLSGGVLISVSVLGVYSRISKNQVQDKVAQERLYDAVESINERQSDIEYGLGVIMDSIEAQGGAIQDMKSLIRGVDGRLVYYIKHQEDMTTEQILDAFEIGYEQGKKKEMTP